jgi:hypothetical protein
VRVIIEVLGRALVFQFVQGKLAASDDEEFKHAPVDPHSVSGGQVERGPGADSYTEDIVGSNGRRMEVTVTGQPPGLIKFGFGHGS